MSNRRIVSGIVYVIRNGLPWQDAPRGYGPHKTLCNRFVRWSRLGVFDRIFNAMVAQAGVPEPLMIDSTHLTAHRMAASLAKGCSTLHRARSWLRQQPLSRRPPAARHPALHPVHQKPAGRDPHDKTLYRQRHRIEDAFGRLKDRRRSATRHDRCARTFSSAICIAATIIFWLPS